MMLSARITREIDTTTVLVVTLPICEALFLQLKPKYEPVITIRQEKTRLFIIPNMTSYKTRFNPMVCNASVSDVTFMVASSTAMEDPL